MCSICKSLLRYILGKLLSNLHYNIVTPFVWVECYATRSFRLFTYRNHIFQNCKEGASKTMSLS